MATPTITDITPNAGPTLGSPLVRISGADFGPDVQVFFGAVEAESAFLVEGTPDVIYAQAPESDAGAVDVRVLNLDEEGDLIPGEEVVASDAFTFARLASDSPSTALARTTAELLVQLRRHVLQNTYTHQAPDWKDDDALIEVIPIKKTPSLILGGPSIEEDTRRRPYGVRVIEGAGLEGVQVDETSRQWVATLEYRLTGAARSVLELSRIQTALVQFLQRRKHIRVKRTADPDDDTTRRHRIDRSGALATDPQGDDGLAVFFWGLRVYAVPIDEGVPRTAAVALTFIELETCREAVSED